MEKPISINNLTFGYDEAFILKEVDLDIKNNRFYSIIGPNGTGKSTLLKLICNILTGTRGSININEYDVTTVSSKWLAKKIAFVPQNTFIDFDFNVEEVITMGRTPYLRRFQTETAEDKEKVKESMILTDTYHLRHKRINEISGGERQRVIIAKAIAQDTEILLLDEPVSHLDIHHQVGLLNVVKKLQHDKNLTIITVLHDLNLAASYSDEIILLHNKRICKVGSPDEVITRENVKKVYDMDVLMMKNPLNNKPFIVPIM